ncbi:MAG: 30S ribosomal protein S12 methylthiotransferase RimO [Deltaproteobacteria bacterium]|jgi:tRNA-2-methylthio-N6-dimethylallyladenosine synthase/ribosomal protein S12 methylthiotransferase|nr:30S ribosomal protein S12 methylthiotransferase RimO [Deltaproteobacteria bacterium]
MSLKVYSISLGCPKNRVDSERLLGSLGLSIRSVKRPGSAQLIFINTCGFIEPAVRESVRVILDSIAERSTAKADKPLLVVGGCLVGRYGAADLAADLPEVDLWLPTAELADWPVKLLAALQTAGKLTDGRVTAGRLLSTGPSYAWMKISEGCGQSCSFCTIPQIRGKVRSLEADFIAEEASGLLKQGVSELILVAQDLTSWGQDLKIAGKKPELRDLLEKLLPLPGLKWLRLMYLYPAGLTEDLLKFLRDAGPPFIPYFDIPLQHADSGILTAMGRPFSQSPFKVVERVRKYLPEAALRTSLITGFPGETEENFATLCRFVQEARFQNLGVFAYEAEDGTPAATMQNQIPVELRTERRDRIMELQAEISAELLQGHLGQNMDILVDEPHPEWPGLYVGRTWFQAPEVDGVTYVSGENLRPGDFVRAEISETFEYDLNALVP